MAATDLVLLYGGIGQSPDIVVDVKVEQRSGFTTRFVDDEPVEGVILGRVNVRGY